MNNLTDNTLAVGPTLWGYTPATLHHAFWRACGLQVVSPGTAYESAPGTKLYLLAEADTLVLFHPRQAVDRFCWVMPRLLCIRLHAREPSSPGRLTRLGLTSEPELAQAWNCCPDAAAFWRVWRREIPQTRRAVMSQPGRICRPSSTAELTAFMQRLAAAWRNPEEQLDRAQKVGTHVWKDVQTTLPTPVQARGAAAIWLGTGQSSAASPGPGKALVLWDVIPNASPNSAPLAQNRPLFGRGQS